MRVQERLSSSFEPEIQILRDLPDDRISARSSIHSNIELPPLKRHVIVRTRMYIASLVLLFLAFMGFVVGFASPFWRQYTGHDDRPHSKGMWKECEVGHAGRMCLTVMADSALMRAVQALQCIAMLCVGLSLIHAAATDACRILQHYSRFVEVTALIGGVSGLAGILVYLAEHFEAKLTFPDAIFSWGFILDTTACFAIVVIAIIISLNNHKPISLQGQDVECSGSSLNEGNAEVPRATGNGDVVLVNVIEETSEFQGDEHVNRDEKERVAESRL